MPAIFELFLECIETLVLLPDSAFALFSQYSCMLFKSSSLVLKKSSGMLKILFVFLVLSIIFLNLKTIKFYQNFFLKLKKLLCNLKINLVSLFFTSFAFFNCTSSNDVLILFSTYSINFPIFSTCPFTSKSDFT